MRRGSILGALRYVRLWNTGKCVAQMWQINLAAGVLERKMPETAWGRFTFAVLAPAGFDVEKCRVWQIINVGGGPHRLKFIFERCCAFFVYRNTFERRNRRQPPLCR